MKLYPKSIGKKTIVLCLGGGIFASGVLASSIPHLSDIAKSKYKEAIVQAVTDEYMSPVAPGAFRPSQAVTRGQLAQILTDFEQHLETEADASPLAPEPSSPTTMLQNTMNAVVKIQNGTFKGAGILIAPDVILTANHVVNASPNSTVSFYNKSTKITVQPAVSDAWQDIALIQLTAEQAALVADITPVEVASAHPLLGESAYAFGHPQTLDFSVTKGIISNADQRAGGRLVYQFDGQVHPGNSGGALVNERGEVLGVITSLLQDPHTGKPYQGLSFATKQSEIRALLEKL